MTASRLIPTDANGEMSTIRSAATAFNGLPSVVARTVGHAMLWTVMACSRNITDLQSRKYDNPGRAQEINKFIQTAKDVMVFAGLIRYKLPGRVWEALAKVGGDVGAY